MNKTTTLAIVVAILLALGVWYHLRSKDSLAVTDQFYDQKTEDQLAQDKELLKEDKNENTMQETDKVTTTATLHTNMGDVKIEFFDTQAPNTVANFKKLAETGFYDGVKFHRVIKGFMVQGGDPLTKDDAQKDFWGTGGPGYSFNDEITPTNRNAVGTISMANAGPNTNGSQFFINVADNNFLDTKHTVFGKVVAGMEVVKKIEATETDQNDRPIKAVVINSITLE